MNLLFLNYHSFDSQSAIHIFHFANELVRRNVQCTVAVPDSPQTVQLIGSPLFSCIDFEQARNGHFAFPDARPPDLLHAWTPREIVRRTVEPMALLHRCPYVIHLEDNESILTADAHGTTADALSRWPEARLDETVALNQSHPHRARNFIERAAAVTAIIDRLLEFKPEGLPGEVIWPSYGAAFAEMPPTNPALRKRLGLTDDCFVVAYPGNVHSSNIEEVRSLYLAILLLNRRGHNAKLVRVGIDQVPLFDLDPDPDRTGRVELGFLRPHSMVAEVLSMADALVQPGSANAFNDYRLPAKLPEFLISGRPVLLPNSNIGRYLENGVSCLHLRTGTAVEIANILSTLIADAERRRRIGQAGRDFAARELSWTRSAEKLHRLYSSLPTRIFRT
jgi:glycosyltransferase involved in cell wall biosynthesis